ncbi:hypothetical protein [Azotobacter chroococcum]|uniref:hypothetical protein n=1 Tax=Azotobacter chroococcum TaxID=353 RepID=UPI0012FDD6DE|nr:hypothetical protein [Azotobacter chroococcum]
MNRYPKAFNVTDLIGDSHNKPWRSNSAGLLKRPSACGVFSLHSLFTEELK